MNQVSSELLPNEWKAASSAFELDVIEDIKYRQSVFKAELSLHEFLKQAWRVIEGGVPFIDNWHLHVVAEHLEACYRREIKNLILNVPPRSGKTSLISVAFPAWVWLQNPEEKFMYASYAHSLSEEHGALCLALIQSDWYQQRWKANFNLTKTAISFLKNNRTGYRIATSVGGVGTGFGASILVCFPYHIMVSTDQGDISIGQIVEEQISCKVLSYNHQQEILEYKAIEQYEKNPGKEILEIEFDDGSILECTPDHPIFIENKGYVAAQDIHSGDVVFSID